MATDLKLTLKRPDGTVKKQKLSSANPNASIGNLATFAFAFNNLSNNDLTGLKKVSRNDIEIPTVQGGGD